ncbi:MAG: hypothetical protein R3240_08045 [Gammaproteobacteria bacterium]|nr:hypothetical protein [Gammaproteobacteria bacterium]
MSNIPTVSRAKFIRQTDAGHEDDDNKTIEVHFNPVSLQYVIANTLKKVGRGDSAKQQVSKSTGKLTMTLIFDTTHEGYDVRSDTIKVARYLKPVNKDLPIVKFVWGTFSFQGMFEKYQETIDFFSAEGVPLRASLNITLASQDIVFSADAHETTDTNETNQATRPPANLHPPYQPETAPASGSGAGTDSTNTGSAGGLSNAAATANAAMGMSASAAAGVSGAIGISAGASASAGISGGIGVNISASVSAGASASIGGTASIGSSASAGVSASQGAFNGLRTNLSSKVTAEVKAPASINLSSTLAVGTGNNASFSVGGKASAKGSLSMKSDVGAAGALRARIQFNEG